MPYGEGTYGSGTFGNPAIGSPFIPPHDLPLDPLKFADFLKARMAAILEHDGDHGRIFLEAIGEMFQEVDDLVRDRPEYGAPGWSVLLDLDLSPDRALDWLSQFTGTRLIQGLSAADKRDQIGRKENLERGRVFAMVRAAQRTLTGNQSVLVYERSEGNAWRIRFATRTSETPDPAATEAAIRSQKPVGIVLTYDTYDGGDWLSLEATHTDWTDVETIFDDWAEILENPTKEAP